MVSIFISYTRSNREFVDELDIKLYKKDYKPWFDRSLTPGRNWKKQLLQQIKSCDVFMYVLSPKSIQSECCWWELTQAMRAKKPVIPLLYQSCDNLPVPLCHVHYVDFTQQDEAEAFTDLVRAIHNCEPIEPRYFKQTLVRLQKLSGWLAIRELAEFTEHTSHVNSVVFSPDGLHLASASVHDSIRIWDITEKRLKRTFGDKSHFVTFSPDGLYIASAGIDGTNHVIKLWAKGNYDIPEIVAHGHKKPVLYATFSPDGLLLASVSEDDTVRCWDAKTGRPIGNPLEGHGDALVFCPTLGSKILAWATSDNSILLWNQQKDARPIRLTGHKKPVTFLAFSPDGTLLASASHDATIRLWDVNTHEAIGEPLKGHDNTVRSLSFSSDSRWLASGSWDKTIRFWDVSRHKCNTTVSDAHSDALTCVTFSPDGTLLASASNDKIVRVWGVTYPRSS